MKVISCNVSDLEEIISAYRCKVRQYCLTQQQKLGKEIPFNVIVNLIRIKKLSEHTCL